MGVTDMTKEKTQEIIPKSCFQFVNPPIARPTAIGLTPQAKYFLTTTQIFLSLDVPLNNGSVHTFSFYMSHVFYLF